AVTIGNQTWMKENLKATKYLNGDAIPTNYDNTDWSNLSTGAYAVYNDDNNNISTYGLLYNWYAVDDLRNIAPEGWRVPTDDDWKELEMYLGMSQAQADQTGQRGTNEGGKLKESGTIHWTSPNTGATNESGYTALPGGLRHPDNGNYSWVGTTGFLWSSMYYSSTHSWARALDYNSSLIDRSSNHKQNGFSIRCIKNGADYVYPPSYLVLAAGDSEVGLSWTASTDGDLANYVIYRGTSSGSLSPVDSVNSSTTTYTDTGITNNTIYYYGVKAKNSAGEYSAMTNEESATPLYNGPVWWVALADSGGNDGNDGSASSPFLSVEKGIQSTVTGDTVMVKAGTYVGNGYRGLNPGGKNIVIMSESGTASTTLDANYGDRHFVIQSGEDTTMQIIGFTFINGSVNADGGSIFFNDFLGYSTNNAIIKDCVFRNNETTSSTAAGGAINVNNSSPIFRNCTIDGNSSIGYGGGVAVYNTFAAPKFQNCTIINNEVTTTAGTGMSANGGGVYVHQGTPVFTDCIIDSNTVTSGGDNGNGGGVFVDWFDNSGVDPVKLIRCFIRENNVIAWGTWEANGGGLAVHARTELINCVITNNYTSPVNGTSRGGGIAVDLWANYNQHEVKIINCTIAENEANAPAAQSNSNGGGIFLDWDEINIMFNTILWGNTAESNANIFDNGANMVTNNNNIEDGEQYNWFASTSISLDPQFTNSTGGDFTLSDASYNIGAGTSGFGGYSAPANDILGNARPNPGGSSPDIGAYENSLAISPYPGQVANLMGQAGHQKVILTWDANSESDLNRYAIYQSTTQDFTPTSNDSIGQVAAGTETFTATGLTNGTPYFYQVTVIDNDGYEGLPSFEIGVTPRYTGPVWYVDDVGTNGEGSSTSPFNQIQVAIDSATTNTDTVLVLPGTYSGVGNFEIYLSAKDLIILSEKGADSTILSSDNNHRHFSISNGVSPNTNIIGFTFKNGQPGNNEYEGGSIWIDGASPQFFNCIFTQNEAENGGAVAVMWSGGLPGFNNCVFRDNVASNTNGEANGGAVFIADFNYASNPIEFNNCTFDRNRVEAKNSARGGALAIYTRVAFENCLIVNNKATAGYQNYTAGETAFGGGIFIQTNNNNVGEIVSMVNTTVANDTAIYGVMGNSIGGGIYLDGWPDQKFDMFNSIVWGNHAVQSGQENIEDGGNSTFRADYNIIENGTQFNRWFYTYNHNQVSDPQFVDAENGNYQLSDFSPAIGAGWTGWQTYTAPSTDIDGNARPYGAGGVYPDLGAYENPLAVSPYPRQVQNLFAEGASYAVDLTWDENPDVNGNIDYYIVYMDTLADFIAAANDSIGKVNQGTQSNGKFTHIVSNLQNNTPYYFRIAAHNSAGYTGVTSEIASAQPGYSEPIWYVDATANPDSADGSPETPFQTIGAAWGEGIANPNFSSGDTIMVLPGTYQRFYDLDLVAPNMPFVLMSQEGPDTTFIDGRLNGSTTQKRFIQFDFGADTTTQIIGFTIQNCTSTENGGAVKLMSGSNPKFMNCTFANNFVSSSDRDGGAVYVESSSPYFLNCSFINNSAFDGGAVSIFYESSEPKFMNCLFDGNSAADDGGAINGYNAAEFIFDHCIFENNSAENYGGAIFVGYNNTTQKWTTISNSLIANNTNVNTEGAAIFFYGLHCRLLIENSTITNNFSTNGGAALEITESHIINSIIWDNTLDNAFENEGSPFVDLNSFYQITNSLIENGGMVSGFNFDNSLDIDPLFTDPQNGDYTLSIASYAIGAGVDGYSHPRDGDINIGGLDLAGNDRIQPSGLNPDLGAYERSEAETPYPDIPVNIMAEELHRAVRLSWDSVTATDVAYYIVYQAIEPDSTNFDSIATVLPGLSTIVDTVTNLTNMTKYYFGIGAVDSSGYESMTSYDIVAVPHYQGPVWYVATDVPSGTGEGSINNPYGNIRKAIFNSNDGDTVLLRPGTYSGDDNRDLNFQQMDEFGGMTTTPRDIVLMGEKGPDSTIIDLSGFGATQRRLLDVTSGEGPNTKLIGLTIQNGEANSEPMIRVENSDLTIENCYFIENINTGEFGAVVLTGNDQSQIDVSNSRFIRNTGSNSVGVFFADNIDITNSIFYQNSARTGAAFGWNPSGGSASSIVNCLFLENISTEYGSGGAIWIQSNSGISIYNSIFWDNINSGGGDQDVAGQNGVHNCSVQDLTSYSADNYSFNPMIVDPENGDFSLSEYSPAIGLGVDQYFDFTSSQYEDIPESDYNGNMRPDPVGSSSDLGPIEHQNAEPLQWVYYVATDGDDDFPNTGKTPDDAFLTIQHAIDNADDLDTVEVLAGTYIGTGNSDLNFFGKDIVLRSSDGPDLTILDLENNAYAFDFYSFEPLSARIIGFTVQNGNFDNGGAVHLQNASPRFFNMKFVNCNASISGGAIFAQNSSSRFYNCIFAENNSAGEA
ncbi:MAG: fibronectin type III domain-containing protein, partial [Candidatus Marinimicrobia bacterium]|nr:fibronectin type III domain-containing protein [Candidatus Neomarinimicrobiota bacterium]